MFDIISFILSKKYTDSVISGGGGTTNYNALSNKPSINGVVLSGDKTTSDLKIKTTVNYTVEDENLIFS